MSESTAMTFLLVDDDVEVALDYENCSYNRSDVRLAGITGNSDKALDMVKEHLPEAVILDIQLHKGKGSGIDFLKNIQGIQLDFKPLIIVITNSENKVVYSHVQKNGAALVFYKQQQGYSADFVLNEMLSMRESLYMVNRSKISVANTRVETLEERKKRLQNRIMAEMNAIGMPSNLSGKKYIISGLLYLLETDDKERGETVFQYIRREYARAGSTVIQSIETAIRHVWDNTPIDVIQAHYTDTGYYHTGKPTPTQFIMYYREKIAASL